MSRPFALCGFTFLLALVLSSFLGSTPSLVLAGVLILCCFLALFVKDTDRKKFLIVSILSVATGLVVFTGNYEINVSPAKSLVGETATIHGVLIETPEIKNDKTVYKIKTDSVSCPNSPQNMKVVITSSNSSNVKVNDKITATVKLMDNSKHAEYANGFYLRGSSFSDLITEKGEKESFYGKIGELRKTIKFNIKEMLPNEEGEVIVAMILGDRSGLSDVLANGFSESGVYHIFAVSGLHVSLWSMLIYSVLRKIRLPIKLASVASCGFVLFYMALTGLTMSVFRAGIMMILTILGMAFFRRTDALNSLGFAVLMIGLLTPMATQSVSFLLTVFATVGVVTLGSGLSKKFDHVFDKRRFKPIFKSVATCLSISFAVTIFTLPVCAIFFKKIALISLLANVVIIPLGTATIVMGGLLGALAPIAVIKYPLALFAGLGAKLMIWLSTQFANVPFGTIGMENSHWLLSIAGILLLAAVAILIGKKKFPTRSFAVSCVFLLIVPYAMSCFANKNVLKIRLMDSFDSITVVASYGSKSVVISTGGYKQSTNIANVLCTNNINSVDLLVAPNLNENMSASLLSLSEMCQVNSVVVPKESDMIKKSFENVIVSENITLDLWDCVSVKYKCSENGFWVGIKYFDSEVICLSDLGMEDSQVDPEFRCPEVVITESGPATQLHGKWNLSTGDVQSRENSKIGKLVSTEGMGDIILKIDDKGNIDTRREIQWEQ